AGWVGGLALVGGFAYRSWPFEPLEGEEQIATIAEQALAVASSEESSDGLHGVREPLPASTEAPSAQRAVEAASTARLSGTFLVDGRPPEWPFEITLATQLPSSSAGPSAPLFHPTHPNLVLAPEERGKFSFGGLPLDWKGRLAVEQFTFLDGTFAQFFDAPAEDLVLHLSARPQIVGRLLEPDGSPAGGVEVTYEYARDNGTLMSSLTTLADGRLRIFGGGWGERATLALAADGGQRGWLHLETAPFEPAAGLDLGELMLEPTRARALGVRATDGSPITDACARIEVARPEIGCAGWTDAAGKATLFLPERPCTVRVSAFGFADQVVTVAPAETLEFALEPLTILSLSLVGTELDSLALRSPQAAFVWDPTDGPDWEYQDDVGAWQWNERTPALHGEPWRYRYDLSQPTTLTLVGLVPDQPFELELFDADGHSLAVHTTRLAAGERAALTLGSALARDER
ncbi:MAG: carboxypeptidase-like regulatory domain-containing protein, partial [Planctomycetota bacterium]